MTIRTALTATATSFLVNVATVILGLGVLASATISLVSNKAEPSAIGCCSTW